MFPEAEVSAFSVFLLGLSLGLTACAVTCMPFIGTWVLGRGESLGGAFRDTASFLGGRLVAYAFLGGIAGAMGEWFVKELASGTGNAAIGLVAIFSAGWLAWPAPTSRACGLKSKLSGLSPFLLGVALTLIPCAPLATLLATSAAGGSVERGALLGLVFGLGALMTPMLVLIPMLANFGRHLRQGRGWIVPWVRGAAAVTLLILGKSRLDSLDDGIFPALLGLFVLVVFWAYYRHSKIKSTFPIVTISIEKLASNSQ
ncbi:MAG: sulfite exporter TauE/SafE family protein [Azonexus sp.]|nr:sulfite exporter TauE/SafE family protein [Azonexus sp.]